MHHFNAKCFCIAFSVTAILIGEDYKKEWPLKPLQPGQLYKQTVLCLPVTIRALETSLQTVLKQEQEKSIDHNKKESVRLRQKRLSK